jgi:hypothetical protein
MGLREAGEPDLGLFSSVPGFMKEIEMFKENALLFRVAIVVLGCVHGSRKLRHPEQGAL